MIELRDVWKTYESSETISALQGISLTIPTGRFFCITGPSGSGKSTLLHLIGALDVPTSGTLLLDGAPYSEFSESKRTLLRRREFGFVFQSYNLLSTLTAFENVMLPVLLDRGRDPRDTQRARDLLQRLGLGARLSHRPAQLSGGELQRVAIARAVLRRPKVILADEPTGNLDRVSGRRVLSLLRELSREEKATVVLVTHDEEAALAADERVALIDGRRDLEFRAGG